MKEYFSLVRKAGNIRADELERVLSSRNAVPLKSSSISASK